MSEITEFKLPLLLFIGYIDLGTGQAVASTLGPILAGASAFLVGIFSFLLIRFKKIFKKRKKNSKNNLENNSKSKKKLIAKKIKDEPCSQ